MKRARTSGELARQAGRGLDANPYRRSSSTRSPRRGSWSEAFARQWALGWREVDEVLAAQRRVDDLLGGSTEPAAAGAREEEV